MIFIIAVIILVDSVYHSTIILSYGSGGKEEGEGSISAANIISTGRDQQSR